MVSLLHRSLSMSPIQLKIRNVLGNVQSIVVLPHLQLEVAMQDDVWISESLVMGLHLLLSCVGYDTSCSSPSKTSLIFVLVVIL